MRDREPDLHQLMYISTVLVVILQWRDSPIPCAHTYLPANQISNSINVESLSNEANINQNQSTKQYFQHLFDSIISFGSNLYKTLLENHSIKCSMCNSKNGNNGKERQREGRIYACIETEVRALTMKKYC